MSMNKEQILESLNDVGVEITDELKEKSNKDLLVLLREKLKDINYNKSNADNLDGDESEEPNDNDNESEEPPKDETIKLGKLAMPVIKDKIVKYEVINNFIHNGTFKKRGEVVLDTEFDTETIKNFIDIGFIKEKE